MKNANQIEQEIQDLKTKLFVDNVKVRFDNKFLNLSKNNYIKVVYNIFVELSSCIIVLFIIKNIFQIENMLIFGIVGLLCACGSLYNLLKRLYREKLL